MINVSSTAMILAAGYGKRLGDITKNIPKPLVSIENTCCLDISIKALEKAGFKRIITNTHYLAEQIEEYVKSYKNLEIILSYEPVLLETAGGVRNVLNEFDDKPFVVINADMYWEDLDPSIIHRMVDQMCEADDFCLCVTPLENAKGHSGRGDFVFDGDMLCKPTDEDSVSHRYVYIGVQLINPRVIKPLKIEPMSLLHLYMQASQEGKLRGIIFNNTWVDVGNVEGLKLARDYHFLNKSQ